MARRDHDGGRRARTSQRGWPRGWKHQHRRAKDAGREIRPDIDAAAAAEYGRPSNGPARRAAVPPPASASRSCPSGRPDPGHIPRSRRYAPCSGHLAAAGPSRPGRASPSSTTAKPRPRNSSITSKYFSMNSVWPLSSTQTPGAHRRIGANRAARSLTPPASEEQAQNIRRRNHGQSRLTPTFAAGA